MAIARTLKRYLDYFEIEYELIKHDYATTSMRTAEAAHISGENLAKAVLLYDGEDYIVAVLPATHQLHLGKLHKQFHRYISLATEKVLQDVFEDCSMGAIPPLGGAYGMNVIIDQHLDNCDEVYFDAGTHTDLVHIDGADFRNLMVHAYHGEISRHC